MASAKALAAPSARYGELKMAKDPFRVEDLRRNASDCVRLAQLASTAEEEERWAQIAEYWLERAIDLGKQQMGLPAKARVG
jgi:hypothetical protein